MKSKDFNQTIGPKHRDMMGPVLECLKKSDEPLNVEGVRGRLNYSRGSFVAIRVVLQHLHGHGVLTARMIRGSMHYSLAKAGEETVPSDSHSGDVDTVVSFAQKGEVHQVLVKRKGKTVAVALPFGVTPDGTQPEVIQERIKRGLSLMDQLVKNKLDASSVPAPPPSQEIPIDDLRRGEKERVRNRWVARGSV